MSETPYDQQPTNAELELAEIKRMDERKPQGVPSAKVTIFIEIGDKIKKIEISEAYYLTIENRYKDQSSNGIQFSLICEPQYNFDRNNYLTEEIRTVDESWLHHG
jgi:hypothetical protein